MISAWLFPGLLDFVMANSSFTNTANLFGGRCLSGVTPSLPSSCSVLFEAIKNTFQDRKGSYKSKEKREQLVLPEG